MFLYLLIKLPV